MYFRSKRILIKDNPWMLLACYKGNFFHVKPIPPTHRSVGHNKSCIRRWTLCWNLGCLCFTKSTQISTQSLYQNERLSKKNRYPASVCYLWHNFSLSMRSYIASAAMWAAAHNPPVIVNQVKWHGKKERQAHLLHMVINVGRIIWRNQHHKEPIMLTGSGLILLNHSHSPMNCTANAFWIEISFLGAKNFPQSVTSVETLLQAVSGDRSDFPL